MSRVKKWVSDERDGETRGRTSARPRCGARVGCPIGVNAAPAALSGRSILK